MIAKNVNFEDEDYKNNIEFINRVNDLYRGTREIKASGKKYLNQFALEENSVFNERLKVATLYNVYQKSINNLSAILLRKTPKIDYKVKFESFIKNIDGKGTSLTVFMKEVAKNALIDGLTYIWVDSQKITEKISIANKSTIKPFLKMLYREDVLNKKISFENGVARLTQITIKQTVLVNVDEFKTKEEDIYIVLREDVGLVYKKVSTGNFELIDFWDNELGYIPIIPVYAQKEGFLEAGIPFLDLAYLNVQHYNAQSNLDSILVLAAIPVPIIFSGNEFGKDTLKKEGISIGVSKALSFQDKSSEGFEWAEISGSSIDKLQANLDKIEERMEKVSLSVLVNNSFNTATEALISDSNSNLFLLELAYSLENAINKSFEVMSDYLGTVIEIKIELSKDFSGLSLDAAKIDKFIQMKNSGLISLDTFWDELIKGEILSINDYDLEKQKIADEQNLIGL